MPNLDEIMKMAQNAQAELLQAQDDLDKVEVEGVSGGGLVKIRATAKGRILARRHRREPARSRPRSRWSRIWSPPRSTTPAPRPTSPPRRRCSKVTGGLQLPPGFKMPF